MEGESGQARVGRPVQTLKWRGLCTVARYSQAQSAAEPTRSLTTVSSDVRALEASVSSSPIAANAATNMNVKLQSSIND